MSDLQESTRCWLYGLHGASVALSRAFLEESLRSALYKRPPTGWQSLESLIDAAEQKGKLDQRLFERAHSIRKIGNKFLHGETITELDAKEAMESARAIAEKLFSA